jgi:hypothetical protein
MGKATLGIALAAVLLAPAGAGASPRVLPPGNSAVNQYTESYPTWRGNAPVRDRGERSAAAVLGKRNADRLSALGRAGREAAAAAAALTPGPSLEGSAGSGADAGRRGAGPSSGFNAVISQATGASSTGLAAVLLPLLIVTVLAGSLARLVRQWRRPAS